jgi:hypothetical protein
MERHACARRLGAQVSFTKLAQFRDGARHRHEMFAEA